MTLLGYLDEQGTKNNIDFKSMLEEKENMTIIVQQINEHIQSFIMECANNFLAQELEDENKRIKDFEGKISELEFLSTVEIN